MFDDNMVFVFIFQSIYPLRVPFFERSSFSIVCPLIQPKFDIQIVGIMFSESVCNEFFTNRELRFYRILRLGD